MKPRRLTLRELAEPQPTIIFDIGPSEPVEPEPFTFTTYMLDTPLEWMSNFPLRGPRYLPPTRYDPPPE